MNNHISILFQGCPVTKSCMKRILLTQLTHHKKFNPSVTSTIINSCTVRREEVESSVVETGGDDSGETLEEEFNFISWKWH